MCIQRSESPDSHFLAPALPLTIIFLTSEVVHVMAEGPLVVGQGLFFYLIKNVATILIKLF